MLQTRREEMLYGLGPGDFVLVEDRVGVLLSDTFKPDGWEGTAMSLVCVEGRRKPVSMAVYPDQVRPTDQTPAAEVIGAAADWLRANARRTCSGTRRGSDSTR